MFGCLELELTRVDCDNVGLDKQNFFLCKILNIF